jgi:membrane associated rhomboid family serine protease
MNNNPYSPPGSEEKIDRESTSRSRIGWFVIPTMAGVFLGGNAMAGWFGTSIGDPFGTSRAAGVCGFIGLIIGGILYCFTRPRPTE